MRRWVGLTAVVALAMLGSQSSVTARDHDRDRDRSLKASLSGFEEPPAVLTTGRGELEVKISRDEESFEYKLSYRGPRGDGDAVPYPRRPAECQRRDRHLALPDGDECRAAAKRGWPGPDLPGRPGRGDRDGKGDRSPGDWPRGTRRRPRRIRGIAARDAPGSDVCQRPQHAAKPGRGDPGTDSGRRTATTGGITTDAVRRIERAGSADEPAVWRSSGCGGDALDVGPAIRGSPPSVIRLQTSHGMMET